MHRVAAMCAAAFAGLLTLFVAPGHANSVSDALRAKASLQVYNLDRDQALDTFRQAVKADPQDAAAYRGVATTLWLSITFHRGNMTVDDYLGRDTKPATTSPPPQPDVAAGFRDAL